MNITHYRDAWLSVIYDATGDYVKSKRAMELADLNGLFDPIEALAGHAQRPLDSDVRWAVNVLLEKIAEKFEGWDTHDLWRSDAAATVRSFKHDLTTVTSTDRCGEVNPILKHCDEIHDLGFEGGWKAMAEIAEAEIERVRAGLRAIVDLKNPLPRAAVREVVAELLATLSSTDRCEGK